MRTVDACRRQAPSASRANVSDAAGWRIVAHLRDQRPAFEPAPVPLLLRVERRWRQLARDGVAEGSRMTGARTVKRRRGRRRAYQRRAAHPYAARSCTRAASASAQSARARLGLHQRQTRRGGRAAAAASTPSAAAARCARAARWSTTTPSRSSSNVGASAPSRDAVGPRDHVGAPVALAGRDHAVAEQVVRGAAHGDVADRHVTPRRTTGCAARRRAAASGTCRCPAARKVTPSRSASTRPMSSEATDEAAARDGDVLAVDRRLEPLGRNA